MSNNKDKILGAAVALLALIVAELQGSTTEAPVAEEPTPEPKTSKSAAGKPAKEEKVAEGPTLASLREKAQALLTEGKAAEVKAALTKFKTESLTKLDAKHYVAMDAALDALSVQ